MDAGSTASKSIKAAPGRHCRHAAVRVRANGHCASDTIMAAALSVWPIASERMPEICFAARSTKSSGSAWPIGGRGFEFKVGIWPETIVTFYLGEGLHSRPVMLLLPWTAPGDLVTF